jgi:ubiquinol-cytochrome c reductase subunit 7
MPAVQEALKRISDKEQFDRTFRIRRAMQLQMQHDELPREEWITAKTDTAYLWKHITDVCHEQEERKKYDSGSTQIPPKRNFV